MIIYKYVRPGETYGQIPARDLSEAEYEQALQGRSKKEKALIGTLYERAMLIDLTSDIDDTTTTSADGAQPAEQAEETTDGNTDRI